MLPPDATKLPKPFSEAINKKITEEPKKNNEKVK